MLFSDYLPESVFDVYYFVAIPCSFLVAGIIGYLLERTVICHLYGRSLDSILATWGVSLFLQQLARSIFGAPNVDVKAPNILNGSLVLFNMQFPYKRLFIIALVIFAIACIYLLLFKTHYGRKIRAVMQNRTMAASLGINTRRIDAYTFAFGSGIAGIAGTALSLLGSIGPTLGTNYIVDTFMVVVLGGVGTLIGTISGGFIIGMSNTTFEFFTDASLGKVIVFTLVILFLQWKPKGLFSIKSRALDED